MSLHQADAAPVVALDSAIPCAVLASFTPSTQNDTELFSAKVVEGFY